MALVCALSNEIPEKPCVAPSSGNVFDRRLIEKYLKENGPKDPINGLPLEVDQLVDINVSQPVKAKPPSATSVPAILKALQVMSRIIFCLDSFLLPLLINSRMNGMP